MADKWQVLEEEMKLLKNEIKQVLLDIKERIENPANPATLQPNVKKISMSSIENVEKTAAEDIPPALSMPKVEQVTNIPAPGSNGKKAPEALDAASIIGNVAAPGGNGKTAYHTPQATHDIFNNNFPVPGNSVGNAPQEGKPSADLLTVAMLSRWLANGVKKVGRQRMEALVDIYSQLGGFPAHLKDPVMKLLNTDDGDGQSMNEGVSILIELDNLMHRSLFDRSEAAMLSLFLNGNGKNGNGKEAYHR